MADIPSDLNGLCQYLQALNLSNSRVPTIEETKSAYKALLKKHPDKNPDNVEEATAVFQSIQEAYRIVCLFIADHCDHKEATSGSSSCEDDQALLNLLASKNRLKYNKDSVTFSIDNDKCEAWIASIEKKINASREPITDKNKKTIGYKVKNDKVKIPYFCTEVSVTVSIWPNPSDGVSKMLVQGRGYWLYGGDKVF